ncbi:MAG TPA: hypothetical protein VF646_17455 [Cytophagales bacterium]
MLILHVPFIPARGMALFPFILLKDARDRQDACLIRHERIHLRQQLELLIVPFYLWYLLEYGWHRFRGMGHHGAYLRISFEREAYQHDRDPGYLARRKWGSFLKYV